MASQEIASTSWYTDANLKAYYRFSTGALTTDSSGESHTLTAISDPAETTGMFDGGVVLDGNDAYSASDHADFKPTGSFTIGCWLKGSSSGYLFQSYSKNTKNAGILIYLSASTGRFLLVSGKNTGTTQYTDFGVASGTTDLRDNNWHFVVGTWNGSKMLVYVDGVREYAAGTTEDWSYAPVYAATNYVRVGCYNESGLNGTFYTGTLDDVFLINGTALSATDISTIYNGAASGPANLKTLDGLAKASVKTIDGLAIASVKSYNGLL